MQVKFSTNRIEQRVLELRAVEPFEKEELRKNRTSSFSYEKA
jgi:hypothetical protein